MCNHRKKVVAERACCDADDPALESDSFDDDVPPAGAAQGNPAVPGDDLDALIDDMEDELPGTVS